MTEEKKMFKSLIGFHRAIKSTTTTEEEKKVEKRKKIPKILQNKSKIRIINAVLESLLSSVLSLAGSPSPPCVPRMPSNTVLISGPAVGPAQILI